MEPMAAGGWAVGASAMVSDGKIVARGKKIAAHMMEASVRGQSSSIKRHVQGRRNRPDQNADRHLDGRLCDTQLPDRGTRARPWTKNAFYIEESTFPAGLQPRRNRNRPETGVVEVVNSSLLMMSPGDQTMIVEGQVQGGWRQGVGPGALRLRLRQRRPARQGSSWIQRCRGHDNLPTFRWAPRSLCTPKSLGVKAAARVGRHSDRRQRDQRRCAMR